MEIPRVTEILKPFTNFDNVPPKILEGAAARGTSVHAICAALAKGEWIPDSMIEADLKGYVDSFKLWAKDTVGKFLVIEKRYHHDFLEYSGQVDFVIETSTAEPRFTYLVDIKTGKTPQKTFPLQMAAYKDILAYHKIEVDGAILVYLDKEGEYPKQQFIYDFKEATSVFAAALTCWKYFNKGKKDERKDRAS